LKTVTSVNATNFQKNAHYVRKKNKVGFKIVDN
jgi:hypothetical protein